MLLRVFRENQAFTVLLLFLLTILLWGMVVLKKTFEPGIHTIYDYSGFYLFPSLRTINNNLSLSTILNILLVLFSGFYLSRITYKYQLIPGRNLMPMLIFFFFSLPWFSSYTGLSFPLLTLPILLYITDKLFQSADKKPLSFSYFNCAIILSASSLLNHYLAFYLLFVFFLFFRLRGAHWREFVFIILGAVLPYFFLFGVLYLFDANISGFLQSIRILWQYKLVFESGMIFRLFGAFLLFLFLIGSWQALNQYVKMKILARKYSVVLLVLFLISLLIILFVPSVNQDSIFFIATPLSFLFGYYFTTCRINIINQVLFVLLLIGNVSLFVMSFF